MANQTKTLPDRESSPVLGAVYICLAVTIMATNGITVFVNVKSQHLQIPTLHVLTGIGGAAFVTGFHLLMYDVPLCFSSQLTCDNTFITAGAVMAGVLQAFNIFQAMLAVLDRYVAVCHPLHYIAVVTGRNIVGATVAYAGVCFVVFLCALTVSWTGLHTQGFQCVLVISNHYVKLLYTILLLAIPVCVIALSYMLLCKEYRAQRHTESSVAQGGAPIKFPWLITSYLACGAISFFPSFVVRLSGLAPEDSPMTYGLQIIQRLSCFMNIFIFAGTFRPFRNQVSRIFCPSHYRRQRRNSALRAALEHNTNMHVTSPQPSCDLSTTHTTDIHAEVFSAVS